MKKTESRGRTRVHPTALVGSEVELGVDVEIGPYSIVEGRVRIGDRTKIHAHAQILNTTSMGADNVVFGGAILGGIPQDRKFNGEQTRLEIGDRNHFREHCTVHLGTAPPTGTGVTRIGDDNLIMACSHVAHDCVLDGNVTLGNNVLLAGHTHVEHGASISGGVAVHQFATIGTLSYVGGLARVAMDVPPYLIFEGRPGRPRGLNLIGLERRGLASIEIDALKEAYRLIYRNSDTREAALAELEARSALTTHVRNLVTALRRSDQGHRGRYLESRRCVGEPPAHRDRIQDSADTQDMSEAGAEA